MIDSPRAAPTRVFAKRFCTDARDQREKSTASSAGQVDGIDVEQNIECLHGGSCVWL
jgi:hypothetical protein